MSKLKVLLKQLMCLHFWIKGLPVDIQYGKGYKHVFECARCDKRIERWSGNEPISGSTDPLYDKKDPLYNAGPPVIYVDRSEM